MLLMINRTSVLPLENGFGNSSIVYNNQDFGKITHLNMTTGLITDGPCFRWCEERESIFNCYPNFVNYSNFLLNPNNVICNNDDSCYYWYLVPDNNYIYENVHLVDQYGTCF